MAPLESHVFILWRHKNNRKKNLAILESAIVASNALEARLFCFNYTSFSGELQTFQQASSHGISARRDTIAC